jgi:acetyl-CoA synthetase
MPDLNDSFAAKWLGSSELADCHRKTVDERIALRDAIFEGWNSATDGPAPIWYPSEADIANSNLTAFLKQKGCESLDALRAWWQSEPSEFWAAAIKTLDIKFQRQPESTLQFDDPRDPIWLKGAQLNIVESCFSASADAIAIRSGSADGTIDDITYGQLKKDVELFAKRIVAEGFDEGDRLAIVMPMNVLSVIVYLAILHAGCTAVSIADSFSATEIAKRLRISKAKGIFCVDDYFRAGKRINISNRVTEAVSSLNSNGQEVRHFSLPIPFPPASEQEAYIQSWLQQQNAAQIYDGSPRDSSPDHVINILFSSGTTGDPKAIPWDQTTPLKCGTDGRFHQNIKRGDVVVWPTNLGWMMGPWLIFATLLNRATIGLFDDAPTGESFGKFVQDSKATMLGVVPAIVRHWKRTKCMEAYDWSSIKCFSSTGEASNEADMIYLSALAAFKPIIEYCGGTEIGGGYISSTVLQPNVPAAFSSVAVGSRFEILDEDWDDADEGELFLVPPAMGLSRKLLNRDHFDTYYADLPRRPDGTYLRRHGDRMQRLPGGYFRACGRSDDTMNPGGIKIGSAEIEAVLNANIKVIESAVIAESKDEAGNAIPDRLVAFVVSESEFDGETIRNEFNVQLREQINPLIRIARVEKIDSLPRTASNKIMRRELRSKD